MERNSKIAVGVFTGGLLVLAAMLWMPIYLAGPDGLEQVTFDLTGNNEYEPESDFEYTDAPFPDYEFVDTENGYGHAWVIGLIGSIIAFAVIFGLMKVIALGSRSKKVETEVSA